MLDGKLYITDHPSWLNELIAIGGKYYIVYPPMPAIVLLPSVFLLGQYFSQTIFSIILGAINVVLVYLLFKRLNFSNKTSFFVTIFFAFGTNHWYLASVGSAWFIAHITALFFLLLALFEVSGKKRFLLDALYNFLRFNNFSPLSPYQLIPGIVNDPIFQQGFMNIAYIPRHIEAILLRLPQVQSTWPFLIPSLYSTALWFTSPAFIYIFKAKKSLLTVACWVAIIATLLVVSLWGGVGFAQFGYRFAQDFMPFLLILLAIGIGNKPSKIFYLLWVLSILVNAWGVIMINKLNIYAI